MQAKEETQCKQALPNKTVILSELYINDLSNLHKSTEFVLFADDTSIFVKAKNKALAYEKANTIIEFVNLYMMTNKLHINMSKSCFIDFKSEKNSSLPNEELKVLIQNIEIKRVTEAKFLEVAIDENLHWNSHLKKLYKNCHAAQAY